MTSPEEIDEDVELPEEQEEVPQEYVDLWIVDPEVQAAAVRDLNKFFGELRSVDRDAEHDESVATLMASGVELDESLVRALLRFNAVAYEIKSPLVEPKDMLFLGYGAALHALCQKGVAAAIREQGQDLHFPTFIETWFADPALFDAGFTAVFWLIAAEVLAVKLAKYPEYEAVQALDDVRIIYPADDTLYLASLNHVSAARAANVLANAGRIEYSVAMKKPMNKVLKLAYTRAAAGGQIGSIDSIAGDDGWWPRVWKRCAAIAVARTQAALAS